MGISAPNTSTTGAVSFGEDADETAAFGRIDPGTGEVFLDRRRSPIDQESSMATLYDLLPRLHEFGISDDEYKLVERSLKRRYRDSSGGIANKTVGHLVYVQRILNGIRVLNNQLVLAFDSDGIIRTVLGNWPELRYDISNIGPLKIDETHLKDKVVIALAEYDYTVSIDDEITIDTVYYPTCQSSGCTVDYKFRAWVKNNGAEEEGYFFSAIADY